MNKKGQTNQIGVLITLAIVIIVGSILIQASAQNVGTATNTFEVANESISTVVNGTAQYLVDYRALSDVVIYNETGDVIVGDGNYTITNNVINNGDLSVEITPDASAAFKSAWLVSGTAQPLTYIDNGGGRSLAGLI
ncbi:MAG: hypothetical protein J7L82_00690, partial [Staphylothermus sp.]|nr:hypothetical protein [Staphylothermus sp.]